MAKVLEPRKGRWTHQERRITYFCRNCWHHATFAVPADVLEGKTKEQIKQYATDVHAANGECKQPEAVLCPSN